MKSGLDENSMVPVFVVGRDLHLHYPLESLPSRSPLLAPIRDRQHRTSHKNEIHHILAETTRRATVAGVASYGGERNNNDDAMPTGGRGVIIRLFVTITIMLSRSKIVVFLLALHDTTICYFRPAQPEFQIEFLFQFWVEESRSRKNRPHYSYPLLIFASLFILENVKKVNNVKTFYCFNKWIFYVNDVCNVLDMIHVRRACGFIAVRVCYW